MSPSHSDNATSDKWLCIWCNTRVDSSLERCNNCGTVKMLPSSPAQHIDSKTDFNSNQKNAVPDKNDENISSNPLLIKCESCSWQFSKRAPQCPKCGWKPWTLCNVCQQKISPDSISCPECGDPAPFESNHASIGSAGPSVSKKTADELQHVSLNTRQEAGNSKSGPLVRDNAGVAARAEEKTSTVKRSIFIATIMTIVVIFLNVSFGDKKPHNMYWTWAWIYLTAEIWKYWGWKALIPYPAYIVFGSVLAIIVAQNSSEMNVPRLAMAIANIIGIVIFYIAYRRAKRAV